MIVIVAAAALFGGAPEEANSNVAVLTADAPQAVLRTCGGRALLLDVAVIENPANAPFSIAVERIDASGVARIATIAPYPPDRGGIFAVAQPKDTAPGETVLVRLTLSGEGNASLSGVRVEIALRD